MFSVQWSCEKAVSTTNAVLRRTQKYALGKCGVLTSAVYLVLGLILYKLEAGREALFLGSSIKKPKNKARVDGSTLKKSIVSLFRVIRGQGAISKAEGAATHTEQR